MCDEYQLLGVIAERAKKNTIFLRAIRIIKVLAK